MTFYDTFWIIKLCAFYTHKEDDFLCPIVALHNKNIFLEESVKRKYLENMFKYRPGFYVHDNPLKSFLSDEVIDVDSESNLMTENNDSEAADV